MRRLLPVLATLCACSDATLVFPTVGDVKEWLVVVSSPGLVRGHVLSPADTLDVDASAIERLEALAFTSSIVPLGVFPSVSDGDPLPKPERTFVADLDALSWRTDVPSAAATSLRLPPPPEDCQRYTPRGLSTVDDPEGVRGMAVVDQDGELQVFYSAAWYHVLGDEMRPLRPLFPGVEAIGTDPGGPIWAAAGNEMWSIHGLRPADSMATRTWGLPPHGIMRSLASPRPGVVYGLTVDGLLLRSDTSTTVVIHRFQRVGSEQRGMVIVDGEGVLACYGSDSTFVRAQDGRLTMVRLPVGEGITSIARFGGRGIVVGTNEGILRAEQDEFRELADPLGKMPYGVSITALAEDRGRLYFGGRKLLGEVTPRGFLCQSQISAPLAVRHIGFVPGQVILGGVPLTSGETSLVRMNIDSVGPP